MNETIDGLKAQVAQLTSQRDLYKEQLETTHGQVGEMVRFLKPDHHAPDAWTLRDLIQSRAERLAQAERERDEAKADLKAYVEDTAVTCAYCGARKDRPVTFEDIKAHVSECPKHPMAALRARVEELEGDARWKDDAIKHVLSCIEEGQNIDTDRLRGALSSPGSRKEEGNG